MTMLLIHHPASYPSERQYIFHVLLREFLGLDYRTEIHDRPEVRITDADASSSGQLLVADVLFQTPQADWLTAAALPRSPLDVLGETGLPLDAALVPAATPVIYGRRTESGSYCAVTDNEITLGLDIFGSAFFQLTRYEEVVVPTRDRHDRFPASASLAVREGFLARPVVNEHLELLWSCLARLFPGLHRAPRRRCVFPTFDVDWPAVTMGRSVSEVLQATTADVLKRKEPGIAVQRLRSWIDVQRGRPERDVGNTFDFIMTQCERRGLQATFYFIAADGAGDIDGGYTVEHPWIRSLLRQVHERGHLIGLHPTYQTYRDPCRMRGELDRLRTVCQQEGIMQADWGGRQHFLRWEAPTTWQTYEDAGLVHDSSLSFADQVGFRCGVCYEYPVFNLRTRQMLRLRERPLMAMDATLFGDRANGHLKLAPDAGVGRIAQLKAACDVYHGDFTALWHNNWLIRPGLRSAFTASLEMLAR